VRFLGLDFGDKTIGVSVSNLSGKVATGVTTLTRKDENTLRPNLKELKAIIREYGITHMVIGYPKHLDGRDSPRCKKTLVFKEKLNRYFKSIPVELWDERLSTRAVSREFEGSLEKYKKHVDEMAAVYILQGFLDRAALQTAVPKYKRRKSMENEESVIVLYDEDGDEVKMQVLSSRQNETGTYVLVVEEGEGDAEVLHFKLIEDDADDTIFELVDEEHAEFDAVLDLFKEDYETLGVEIEDFEV